MLIKLEAFRGEVPRLSDRLLAGGQATIAHGVKLWSGELRAFRGGRKVWKPSKDGTKKTLYRWGATGGEDAQGAVLAVLNTTPIQIDTEGPHGLITGMRVFIWGTGISSLDGNTFTVTVPAGPPGAGGEFGGLSFGETPLGAQTVAAGMVQPDSMTLDGTSAAGASELVGSWTKLNGYWFHWTTDIDVARGPIAGDVTERTVFTGDGAPKVTDSSIAVSGGGTDYPINAYDLGIPAPAGTITATPGAGGGCDAALETSVAYVYTYVSGWGEEGPPSAASTIVQRCPGQTVDLSGMSTVPAGNYNIATKRIYRAATGTTGTSFLFLAEIPVANTTYADTTDDEDLGEVLPSETWVAPPADMKGIIALPNGIMAGFRENELCLSEPYLPHAWPIEYRLSTDAPIVAIGAFGASIVVATQGTPYLASGTDPATYSMVKVEMDQACVSKRGLVELHGVGVAYPSPDGLVVVGYGGARLATEAHFGRDEWQLLRPHTIEGYAWEGRYLGVYDDGSGSGKRAFLFDPAGELVFLGIAPTAGFNDILTDSLYLQVGDYIERFDASGEALNAYRWRSKTFVTPKPVNFGVGQVLAASYASLTLKLYGDGVLRHTQTVTSPLPFRFPGAYMAEAWEVELVGKDDIYQVLVGEQMRDLEKA